MDKYTKMDKCTKRKEDLKKRKRRQIQRKKVRQKKNAYKHVSATAIREDTERHESNRNIPTTNEYDIATKQKKKQS